jgi:hypothetical protein
MPQYYTQYYIRTLLRNRILPIWVPPIEKQGVNMPKVSKKVPKIAKKAKY